MYAKCADSAGNTVSGTAVTVTVNSPPDQPQPPPEYPEGESWSHCSIQELSIPTLHWTYSDPNGNPQAASQIKIYGETTLDTGEISCPPTCTSYTPSNDYIEYNLIWGETYSWQVRVKDNQDSWSDWSVSNSFTMPVHAYPWIDFSWAPLSPNVGEIVQFTDQSIAYGGASKSSWSWNFGDGNTASIQDPSHTYSTAGTYSVSLNVCDNTPTVNGGPYCCGAPAAPNSQKDITVSLPLPEWEEIAPF